MLATFCQRQLTIGCCKIFIRYLLRMYNVCFLNNFGAVLRISTVVLVVQFL